MANFTDKEFAETLDNAYARLTNQAEKQSIKKAYLLGGQPGAGKSGLTRLLKESDASLIIVSGDDFRKFHPHYEELKASYGDDYVLHTQEFMGKMTEALINKVSDNGYNLIIEGTLRTVDAPLNSYTLLTDKGYQVEFLFVQVRPELSLLGTFRRYEDMLEIGTVARETPVEHHNNVVKNIPNNLSCLYNKDVFSNIRIYNREKICLYSLKETPAIDPGELIRKEFEREISAHEKDAVLVGYEQVLVRKRNRGASVEELSMIQKERNGYF